jgi:serine/threonine protein kinase
MKTELRALTELCRHINVGDDGVVQARQTTLLACRKCCREYGYENIEGNIWVVKGLIDADDSPAENGKLISHLSTSLYEVLGIRANGHNGPLSNRCPYVVQFIDSFPDSASDGQCIVLEYMRWGSLEEILSSKRVFSESEIVVIAYSILEALLYLKKHHYVHRDIKVCSFFAPRAYYKSIYL